MKLEETRERTLEQARFKMAKVLDAETNYQMSLNQEVGTVRFTRPITAAPFAVADRATFNELINMITIGLNTNRYLNDRLMTLKSIAQQLDTAILEEYGKQFAH